MWMVEHRRPEKGRAGGGLGLAVIVFYNLYCFSICLQRKLTNPHEFMDAGRHGFPHVYPINDLVNVFFSRDEATL